MPRKKKKKTGGGQQSALTSTFAIVSKEAKWKGADLLMTDVIYGNKIPTDAKGKYFWYKVSGYDDDEGLFAMQCQLKAVDPDADDAVFFAFDEDTDDDTLEGITMASVKEGQQRHYEVTTRTKKAEADERDAVQKQLKKEASDPTKVDMSDTDAIMETDLEGGKATAMLDLEFELLDDDVADDAKKQKWKHKLTGREFFQYKSSNGRTWDSGVWNKQLMVVADGGGKTTWKKGAKKTVGK